MNSINPKWKKQRNIWKNRSEAETKKEENEGNNCELKHQNCQVYDLGDPRQAIEGKMIENKIYI